MSVKKYSKTGYNADVENSNPGFSIDALQAARTILSSRIGPDGNRIPLQQSGYDRPLRFSGCRCGELYRRRKKN